MPDPAEADAYTLAGPRGPRDLRTALARPALSHRRHHRSSASTAIPALPPAPRQEQAYLLDAYNRYFAHPDGSGHGRRYGVDLVAASARSQDDGEKRPSRLTRRARRSRSIANGTGGFVTLYGGKLTTHRAFAEDVLDGAARTWRTDAGALGPRTFRFMAAALSRERFSPSPRKARPTLSRRRLPPLGLHLWRPDRGALRPGRARPEARARDRTRRDAGRARPMRSRSRTP